MRIVHTESHRGLGGQEIGTVREAKHLLKRGHEVLVVCQPKSRMAQLCRAWKVPLRTVPGMRSALWSPIVIAYALGFLARYRPHLVHCHSAQDHWTFGLSAKILGIPVVRTRHNSVPPRRIPAVTFLYNSLSDMVIARGELIREQLLDRAGCNPDRVKSVTVGVDMDDFSDQGETDETMKQLGLEGKKVVLCVAAFRGWKGQEDLVRACTILRESVPGIMVLLVGEGGDRPRIETIVEDLGMTNHVTFAGFRDDVPKIMACSTLMALPSQAFEGTPQVIPQAWAAGLPLVTTPAGAIGDMVTDGHNGLLVKPQDVEGLASAIKRIMDSQELAHRLAAGGRASLEKGFTMDWTMDRLLEIYEKVLI